MSRLDAGAFTNHERCCHGLRVTRRAQLQMCWIRLGMVVVGVNVEDAGDISSGLIHGSVFLQ